MKTPDLLITLRLPLREWADLEAMLSDSSIEVETIKLDQDDEALKALHQQAPARRRIPEADINRARDLIMAGKSAKGVAKQLGYRKLAIERLAHGGTYLDVAYTPSEFAPPGVEKIYGTNTFPWLENLKPVKREKTK